MRKLASVLIVLGVFGLCGCGGEQDPPADTGGGDEQDGQSQTTTDGDDGGVEKPRKTPTTQPIATTRPVKDEPQTQPTPKPEARELRIELDTDRLARYGLTVEQVRRAISDAERTGELEADGATLRIIDETGRLLGPDDADAVAKTVLKTVEGQQVALADVAQIVARRHDPAFDAKIERIRDLQRQAEFAEAWKLAIEMQQNYAGDPRLREVELLMTELRDQKRAAARLRPAVERLGSDMESLREVAAEKLLDGGEAGRILLRQAVLEQSPAIAEHAARLLMKVGDPHSGRLFAQRLRKGADEPLRSTLLEAMLALDMNVPQDLLADIYRSVAKGKAGENVAGMRVLAAVVPADAEAPAEVFDERVGVDGAYADLQAQLREILLGDDAAAQAWAAPLGGAFRVHVPGWHGYYYHGTDFEKLVHERLEQKLSFPDRKFPFPSGRQDNVSARWEGVLHIPEAGKYTFYAASDDGSRIFLNGKQIVDNWGMHGVEEKSHTAELKAGTHPIKVEWMQGEQGAELHVRWQPPGGEKQLLTAENVYTMPWKGMEDAKE